MAEPSGTAPSAWWAVEADGVRVFHPTSGASRMLRYPEAALWDLVVRRQARTQVVSKLCAIASLDRGAAAALVRSTIARWVDEGWLTEAPCDD